MRGRPDRLGPTCIALLAFLAVRPLEARASDGAGSEGSSPTALQSLLTALWPDAEREGITRSVFDAAFAEVTPDPTLAKRTRQQPEFAKPIGAYLQSQVTPSRIAQGRAMLKQWQAELAETERRYGVPAAIVAAVWGIETNYGASFGSKDVIRSLATLAAMGYRPELYRTELLAALKMLQDGDVPRDRLRGSWAGAMGQPQFMPSSFERYAVDSNGDGRRDIWDSVPDALASIANFIRSQGWQPDRPWGFQVRLPAGLDPGASRASFADWRARGLTRADGAPMPDTGEGILFFPAGATGPAFLVTSNFEVLKTYNFSDAYVLSVGQLADRLQGGGPIAAAWPTAIPMSRAARIALQTRLVALGYAVDNREGRVSLALRDVIRAAQSHAGLAPDGNPDDALLKALDGQQ